MGFSLALPGGGAKRFWRMTIYPAIDIDATNGQVAVTGWVATSELSALALAQRMDALGVKTIIHTDITTDGMLTGPNYAAQEAMLAAGKFRVIASGGVSQREDVVQL